MAALVVQLGELAKKWDKKFSALTCESAVACDVLVQNQHLLPANGKALDYACGLGANATLLAEHKLETQAWDISLVALDKLDGYANSRGLKILTQKRNVETQPPAPNTFDVIVVANFLHRPSFPALVKAMRKNGLLFYQTFSVNKVDEIGPSNPNFLLTSNELLHLCGALEVLVYREEGVQGDTSLGFRNQAMLVARKCVANRDC